jgi:DNA-binding response OmpR family regulator
MTTKKTDASKSRGREKDKDKEKGNEKVKKVVVIDDDKEFLSEIGELLVSAGYEVTALSDGNDAIREIKEVKPDVVLLDLKMKGRNGFQIANEMSFTPETLNIPVIAMTGYFKKDEHRFLMRTCGIKDVILKPANPLDIIRRIEWLEAGGADEETQPEASA